MFFLGPCNHGNLLGFATTDEIGSVMDMTKTKNDISRYSRKSRRGRRRSGGSGPGSLRTSDGKGVKMMATAVHCSNPLG